jgi:hypothetical protein
MTLRVAGLTTPDVSLRGAVGALVVAAVTKIRQRVSEPGMPQMSSEWLLTYDHLTGRRISD